MTQKQEAQVRAILEIEGFPPAQIERLIEHSRHDAGEVAKLVAFMKEWRLVTETKQ